MTPDLAGGMRAWPTRNGRPNGAVRVLVVDDHDLLRAAYREIFDSSPGFAVVGEAESGEAAVERSAELRPDLLLMDCRMEALDGITATRMIVDRQPGVSVILVSATAVDPQDLAGCGALAFLRKSELSPRRVREIWSQRA